MIPLFPLSRAFVLDRSVLLTLWFAVFLVASVKVSAQDGPFGVGNATGADGQPKLLFWLDGSSPTVGNGQNVLTWPDLSGNGKDFEAPASLSPILRTTGGPNERPYLEFSKEDNRMKLEDLEFSEQGVSIFYVLKTADTQYGMFSFAESDENPRMLLTSQESWKYFFTVDSAEHETTLPNLNYNQWRYFGFAWDGVTNPTYWHRSYGNNAPEFTETGVLSGKSKIATGTAVIGHIQNLLDGGYVTDDSFQGDLAEIFVYDGKVGKAVLRMMNTYFRNKYGVGAPSPWDKLTAPSTHREGLIGLGRDGGSNSEHRYSARDGLVLFANPGGLLGGYAYLSGAHSGISNSVVTTNLPGEVEARWDRDWFMRNDLGSDASEVQIGFDLGEGINGEFPTNPTDYVLLYRNSSTGTFSIRAVQETFIQDDQVRFRVNKTQIPTTGFYTLGTRNQLISSLTGAQARTWYAYKSGNWSDPLTWTLDGSAAPFYINPDGTIPSSGDIATIGSGRTVTADVSTALLKLVLHGTLDLGTQTSHTYLTLEGDGLLRCAGASGASNFPIGNTTPFADPVSGGRVEFYGGGFKQSTDLEVNRLTINLDSPTQEVVMAANLIHNGRFEVEKGVFRVNDNTNLQRRIDSHAEVWVGPQGKILVSASTPGRMHEWNFDGDLINDGGEIKFTNRTSPATATYYNSAETDQYITARFISDTQNQRLLANGKTYLSRLVVNKGVDDTYIFTVSADNSEDFFLLGKANSATGQNDPNLLESSLQNAFALVNGTAEIGNNVFIPLNRSGNYNFNETTTLWVNGGTVAKGAPEMVGGGDELAIVVYGKIKVSAGEIYANCQSGFTLRKNGILQVDGGYLQANQIRTSTYGATNIGGLIINGGEVNVDGTRPGGALGSYYTLSLTYHGNVFRMTGGELRVAGPSSAGLIFINSDPEQTGVSGGTIIAEVKNATNRHYITSRAPFWNLEIERGISTGTNVPVTVTKGSSFSVPIPNTPLYIENSLTIRGANQPTLRMTSTDNVSNDLHVRGNFTIENGGIYEHGNNTTYFDGNASSGLKFPTNSTPTFNDLVIDKDLDSRYVDIVSGNATRALEVLGEFRLEKGSFENNNRNVSLKGNVINRSTVGSESSTGTVFIEGTIAQTLESENGVFHNLTVNNTNGVTLTGGVLAVRKLMRLQGGNFHLGSNRLRVESTGGTLTVPSPSATRCFTTDGSASAGGLQVVFKTDAQNTFFPIGVLDGGTVKYTPAEIKINGFFADPGMIGVTPVNEMLETVDQSGGNSYLNYYWRVTSEDFEQPPRVSHRFRYDSGDVTGDANSLASGRVLIDTPFSREVDSLTTATDHVASDRWVYFNAAANGRVMDGTGVLLVDADYSAGNWPRFVGKPKVYYSRSTTYNAAWDDPGNWNGLSSFSPSDGPYEWHGTGVTAASDYPKAGDIAFIGFDPTNGKPHVYKAPGGGIHAARVGFTPLQTSAGNPQPRWNGPAAADITVLRPTLSVSSTMDIQRIGQITGEGALLLTGDVNFSVTDVSDFLARDSSIVILQPETVIDINGLPPEVPNVFVTSGNNGSMHVGPRITTNIMVRNKLEIAGNADLYMSTGATGDIKVMGDVILDKYQATTSSPTILFANSGPGRTVDIQGNLFIRGNGAQIRVNGPNQYPSQTIHRLIVWKDIIQNAPESTGLKLFEASNKDYIELLLRGSGIHEFTNTAGFAPVLGRLIVDKGIDVNSSFSFNSYFEINGPTNQPDKAITLENGLLKIDHPDIDVTLASGGGDFVIPSSAGLELNSGNLRINGSDIGLLLAGHLDINGGLFEIGNADGVNNYLEYSSSGKTYLEVNGGKLSVGSQLRRGLTNTDGTLDYRQTGGEVLVGVNAAPETNRGVFEVINDGSRFDLTGGTLTLVRGINSSNLPSLYLNPTFHTVGGTGQIIIGNANSPNNAQIKNIGIRTSIELNTLEINNDSGNDPIAKLYSTPLTLADELIIDAGATLDCLLPNLTVRGDILNDGLLEASSNKLTIDHAALGEIYGSGVFNLGDVVRIGGGVTEVNADLEVHGDFYLDAGDMDFGTNEITVRKSATIDGAMTFTSGTTGLTLAGGSGQMLKRTAAGTSHIDILTTDNSQGITMVSGAGHLFVIGKELRLKRGIFNLEGNLLELGVDAGITQVNTFGESNMISTGGAFTNYGVKKSIPANSTNDLFMPLGLDKFMPIRLNFSNTQENYSSGNTVSTYVFRLTKPQHPIIVDDVDDPNPEINDLQNVLQMYFTVVAENVGDNLKMMAEFNYHDDYVAVTPPHTEADYYGARVFDNTPVPDVFKFASAVNPTTNIISIAFDGVSEDGITGDFFAGVEYAIPDNVPVFTTTRDGNVNEGEAPVTGVYDKEVPGGGAPNGAVVHIQGYDELTFNLNGINFYKTIIDENAVLNIDETSMHRIGIVEGTGTIRVANTGSLPSGTYNNFFTCGGGKLEYGGTINYSVLSNIPVVRQVSFTGSGQRNMPNNDVLVCEDLIVDGALLRNEHGRKITVQNNALLSAGTFDMLQGDMEVQGNLNLTGGDFTAGAFGARRVLGNINISSGTFNVGTGGQVELVGNLVKTGGTFIGGTAQAKFVFNGTAPQVIDGSITSPDFFRRLEIDNAQGLTLYNDIDVSYSLLLTVGLIHTGVDSLLTLTTTNVLIDPPNGNPDSFVDGPMEWTMNQWGNKVFPVGKDDRYRPLTLSGRSALRTWRVEHFKGSPMLDPVVMSLEPANPYEVKEVSRQEYWKVNSNTSDPTTARVGLTWGDSSVVSPNPSDYQKLVVMEYDGTNINWINRGAQGSSFDYDEVTETGSFLGQTLSSFTERIFTLGSEDGINPLPVTWLYFAGRTEKNDHILEWATASEMNTDRYVLERSFDGRMWTEVNSVTAAGNSNQRLEYSYVDKDVPTGRVYYRLVQYDFDGKRNMAPNIVALYKPESRESLFDFILFPNPTKQYFHIRADDVKGRDVVMRVADINGRILITRNIYIDESGTSLPVEFNLPAGVYVVNVMAGDKMKSKPLVVD